MTLTLEVIIYILGVVYNLLPGGGGGGLGENHLACVFTKPFGYGSGECMFKVV